MNLLKGEKAPENSKSEIMKILRKLEEEEDTNEFDYEQGFYYINNKNY